MSQRKSNKVDLLPEARRALEIEAALKRVSMKDLASEIIFAGISKNTLDFIGADARKDKKLKDTAKSGPKKFLTKDEAALAKIKALWVAGERNKAEIARQIPEHSPRTIRDWIDKAIDRGELTQ